MLLRAQVDDSSNDDDGQQLILQAIVRAWSARRVTATYYCKGVCCINRNGGCSYYYITGSRVSVTVGRDLSFEWNS